MPPIAKKWHRTRNILSYPFGWQYPAITEQHAFERICLEFPDLQSCTYIGFPWATLIDFLQTGCEEKATPYLEKLVGIPANRTSVTITVSQHIYAARYIKLFESAGITDLFWSHATKGTEQIGSIRIHPFPLFPVRCQDEPDRSAKPLSDRRHLFSFVGAYDPKHYLTAARDWIGRLPRSTEGVIRVTKEWHFFSEVYERQIFDTPVAEEKRANLNLEAAEYRSLLADSVFSLCPSGSGPNSIRLWESLGFGCIPVVISDSLRLPGDLDEWQKAVIFIPEDERTIAELPDTLRAIAKNVNRLQDYVQAGQSLWNKYGPENFIHDILLCAKSRNEQIDIPGSDCQLNVSRRHVISPDNFAEYTYAKRDHFSNFGDHDLELFNQKIDPDYCDLKAYQDLLVFAFIKNTIPKGSRILDVGGGESRILNHFKNDYECWNIDKLEGSGNGPREIHHDGYRLVRDYMGNFSNELPEGYFDFVFSISSLEHVPYGKTEHRELHKNICLDIDRVLKPGGMSLHCFDITVSSTKNCWTNDLAPFMAECFPIRGISVSPDEIAKDPQLFTVSEQYFNSVWKQHPAVSWNYEDGQPSSWNIMWQKPLSTPADDSLFGWHNISKYRIHPDLTHRRISVVTPSFNQANFLEECIQSIVEQKYPNLEYIIMDGGSTDGSVEIIKRYAHFISYWQSQPDGGQYKAIEEGFRKSSGEIMTWLNSDDKFHPHSFTTVEKIFSGQPKVDWIMGRPNGFDESGKLSWIFDYLPRWSREKYLKKEYKNPFIQQEGTFWSRSLWDKAGGYLQTDLKLAGDLELWARFFRHARLYTVDALLAGFRTHPGQKTASLLEEYCLEAERILDREVQSFQQQEQKELLPSPEPLSVHSNASDDSINGKQLLVSAIVSTYNSERFIRGCLEDLVNQTLFHKGQLEIVIIDSGSSQGEKFIVEEFRTTHPTIRYLRTEERETIYEAWNRAIKSSTGKYLTNANTDDRHRDDALEILAAELERDPDLALVYADQIVTETENETFSQCTPVGYFAWPEFDRTQLIHCSCVGPQPMWKRSLHDELGLFNENLKVAGDYDWWLRISESYRIKHIPALLGLYLMNQSGLEIANPGICDAETLALRKSVTEKTGITLDYDAYASCFLVPVYPESKVSPLVSVIVPTHNRPELLAKALRSILDQTFRDFEIIVVNDAGIDVSRLVEHFNSMGTIHYINKKTNEGLAAARNSAIRAARGKYIAYLDDDDTYYPDHLQILTDYLENSDAQIAYTDAHRALQEQKGETFTTVNRDIPYREEFDTDRLLVENYIPVLCVMHERHCLDQVGLFDESLPRHEDWDLWIRLSQKFLFVHIPKTTAEFTHRITDPSGMTSGTLPSMLVTLERIYEKSAPLAGTRPQVIARRKSYLFDLKNRIHGFLQDKLEAISDCPESDTELRENEIIEQLGKTGATRDQILAAYYHKLGLLNISKDPAAALNYFSRALSADPVCCPVHRSIAETMLQIGETEQAVRHCEVIISQEPNDPELIDMVACMTRRLGNRVKADFLEEKARNLRRTMQAA